MVKQRLWKSLKYRDGKIVSDHDKSEWTVGEYRNNPYPVVKECEGLNCCQHIVDAMGYVSCEVLAEVRIRGTKITGGNKITTQEMKILRAWRWTPKDSIELAIYAAELVIGYYEEKYPNDKRPREAIEAAKAYLQNPTKDAADAAYAAAYAAARAAYAAADATYAAYAAAYAADATYAAYAAAYAADAADAAAYAAARAADAAADAAAYAAKKDREKAREEMKTKIDGWIVARLNNREQVQ